MLHSRKLAYLSPSSSPIKKKTKPTVAAGRADIEDNMAVTIKRFEDILKAELAAMHRIRLSHDYNPEYML